MFPQNIPDKNWGLAAELFFAQFAHCFASHLESSDEVGDCFRVKLEFIGSPVQPSDHFDIFPNSGIPGYSKLSSLVIP